VNLIERLFRAFQNPRLFVRGLNRLYYCYEINSQQAVKIDIFDEDWDTLVVLDACRFDMFEQINHLDGTLSSKLSQGSSTVEWLQANFDGRDLRDTVYVTANPQFERNRDRWNISLHDIINIWLDKGWDEGTGTVLADTVTESAIEAHSRFPYKRIVVHYMQPHYPFVPSATKFDKDHLSSIDSEDASADGENVWGQKFTGQLAISDDELWSMYTENLRYVLDHVEDFFDAVEGKVIVTSDHGNYVGERASPLPIREYGHPRGMDDEPVVRVPWLVYEDGPRPDIRTGEADSTDDIESGVVTERLKDLGYRS
jgi:hypothetical protein